MSHTGACTPHAYFTFNGHSSANHYFRTWFEFCVRLMVVSCKLAGLSVTVCFDSMLCAMKTWAPGNTTKQDRSVNNQPVVNPLRTLPKESEKHLAVKQLLP